jgi:hypothetical protein
MVDLLEAVCANRTDKDVFWSVAEHVLASSAGMTEDNEVDEYRWLDVCLVGTIYEHFGEEFLGTDRVSSNQQLCPLTLRLTITNFLGDFFEHHSCVQGGADPRNVSNYLQSPW